MEKIHLKVQSKFGLTSFLPHNSIIQIPWKLSISRILRAPWPSHEMGERRCIPALNYKGTVRRDEPWQYIFIRQRPLIDCVTPSEETGFWTVVLWSITLACNTLTSLTMTLNKCPPPKRSHTQEYSFNTESEAKILFVLSRICVSAFDFSPIHSSSSSDLDW